MAGLPRRSDLGKLLGSFAHRSNLLTYAEQTGVWTAQAQPEDTGKTGGNHAHSRPPSVLECHVFF